MTISFALGTVMVADPSSGEPKRGNGHTIPLWRRFSRMFRSGRKWASRSPADSIRAPHCIGCGTRAQSPTRTRRTSDSPTSSTTAKSPAAQCGARREGAPHRVPRGAGLEAASPSCSAAPLHLDGGRPLLQHDAYRPRGHRHDARPRDEGRRRQHLGRWQHVHNDIERFYRYGLLANPGLHI